MINPPTKTTPRYSLLPNSSPAGRLDEALIDKTLDKHKFGDKNKILDSDLDTKVYALKAKWAKREKFLTESLKTSANKIHNLQAQLNSIIIERDNLKHQLANPIIKNDNQVDNLTAQLKSLLRERDELRNQIAQNLSSISASKLKLE